MNACDAMQEYLDGSLSILETERFEAHLDACAVCALDVAHWTMTRERLAAGYDLDETDPDDALVERLLTRAVQDDAAEAEEAHVHRRSRLPVLLAASVVLAVALGALVATFFQGRLSKGNVSRQKVARVYDRFAERRFAERPGIPLPAGLSEGDGRRIWVDRSGRVWAVDGNDAFLEIETGTIIIKTQPGADPVSVFAGPYVINDIGTTFQVRYSPKELLQVTVADGIVEVGGLGDLPIRVNRAQRLVIREQSAYITLEDEEPAVIGRLRFPFEATVPQSVSGSVPGNRKQDVSPPHAEVALELNLERWRQMVIDGVYADASKEITAFLEQRDDDPRVWSILADCRRKTEDWQGAVKAYEQVLKKGTTAQSERASFLMGEIFQDHLGNADLAVEAYDRFLKTANTGSLRGVVLLRVAESRQTRGERTQAQEALREIIEGSYDDDMKERARALAGRL